MEPVDVIISIVIALIVGAGIAAIIWYNMRFVLGRDLIKQFGVAKSLAMYILISLIVEIGFWIFQKLTS